MTTGLALFGNKVLRSAIQRNLVSFPAQVPVFAKHQAGVVQARISQLYFVRGWPVTVIGRRYSMSREMVRKSLTEWRVRAISSGYIQEIGLEILPAPVRTSELATREDLEDEAADADAAVDAGRKPLQKMMNFSPQRLAQLATVTAPNYADAQAGASSVLHIVLEEIEAGVAEASGWPPFCARLLQILKQACIRAGLHLSTAQIARVEGVLELNCERASDLLRDLRVRIVDEERCTTILIPQRSSRVALLHVLVTAIEMTVDQEGHLWKTDGGGCPSHCWLFVAAIKQACQELGMEFSLAQAKRIENAISADPERLSDLLRDLHNRLADEQEQTADSRSTSLAAANDCREMSATFAQESSASLVQQKADPLGLSEKPGKPEGRILIVDDDYALRRVLHTALVSAGYDVAEAGSGEEALALARRVRCDVVLLDLRMPGKSGIEVCRELRRQFPHLAIVILTVSETEDEKVEALDSGADDYMTKPFRMRELTARLRAVARRVKTPLGEGNATIRVGEIELHPTRRLVYKSKNLVHLTPREFHLLHYLMARTGMQIPHAQLLSAVWGAEYVNKVEYLRTFVGQLRKKLEDDAQSPKYILTDSCVGYRFLREETKE